MDTWSIIGICFFAIAFLTGLIAVIRERFKRPREGANVEFNPGADENETHHQRSRR